MTKRTLFSLLFIFTLVIESQAQVDKNSDLYKTILSKDSLLFNVGFNTCDIPQFENLLSEKFEFFHDKDGISDKTKFLADFRNGLCKNPSEYQARRELIPGSTKIFALYKSGKLYGAIQEGVHQFFEKQTGKPEKFGSSAKFTHVWLLENDEWKLFKSLSFEHVEEQISSSTASIFDDDIAIGQWIKENKVPTLGIGIIENGKLRQLKVFGEITKGVAAPYNTIFNVASLTKPVTAMVALKLVSLGQWNLDEPLYKYWTDPDIANDPRNKKLTTRLILSHQTGFPNWRYMNKDKKLSFQFDPGTKYQYSGEGLEYLRKALERKFKKSLTELASELIFKPLKMQDTKFVFDHIDTSRLALPYYKDGNTYPTVKSTTPNGADDLMTTIEDYGKFLVSVMDSDGLSKQVFNEMITNQVASIRGKHFGLGFEKYDLGNGEYALSHGGSDKGVQTIVFIFPKTKQGLLIFTNSDTGTSVYEKIITHYLGEKGQKIVRS
ncbi:MAG: class A beta-lactamase-related serine hydrolase, partial [Bacteroidetes bacterium]|nr:class A beta-lactamase-related serine hydrolase [Bacteroidota bacterium]